MIFYAIGTNWLMFPEFVGDVLSVVIQHNFSNIVPYSCFVM